MNKTLKRILSVVLSVLMIGGCMSAAFAVDEDSVIEYSAKGQTDLFDLGQNLEACFDAIDKALAENAETDKNHGKIVLGTMLEGEIDPSVYSLISNVPGVSDLLNFTIDYTSVDGLLGTIDDVKGFLYQKRAGTANTYIDSAIWSGIKAAVDFGNVEDLSLANWKTGLGRDKDLTSYNDTPEQAIIVELFRLVNANIDVVSKIADNSFTTGDLGMTSVDILGEGGVKGMIKKLLAEAVYTKPVNPGDGASEMQRTIYNQRLAEYNADMDAAMAKSVDDIIFDIIVPELLAGDDDVMPGFLFDETTTFNALLINAFNICWGRYLAPMLEDLDVTYDINNALAMSFEGVVDLNFTDEPFESEYTFDSNKAFTAQLNNFVGFVVEQIIPGFDWADSEDATQIGKNIQDALLYVLEQADFSGTVYASQVSSLLNGNPTFDEIALLFVKVIIAEFGGKFDTADVQACTSVKGIAKIILVNAATENLKIDVSYSANDDYLDVIADMLAYAIQDIIPLYSSITENPAYATNSDRAHCVDRYLFSGKYTYGEGKELEEVINSIASYYMYGKRFALSFGVGSASDISESGYEKINSLIAMLCKNETMSFDIGEFLFGGSEKGLIDAVFSLDIQRVLNMTVIAALDAVDNQSAVKFIYTIVKNLFDNLFDAEDYDNYIIANFATTDPFDNMFSDANMGHLAASVLTELYTRRASLPYTIGYVLFFALFANTPAYTAVYGASADDVNVVVDGVTLVKGKDYIVTTDEDNRVIVTGIGNYRGSVFAVADFNKASVTFEKAEYDATGSEITPEPIVKLAGITLVKDVDYTCAYANNIAAGTATVTVTGIGSYTGTAKGTFNIRQMGSVAPRITATYSGTLKVAWDQLGNASGYLVNFREKGVETWTKRIVNNATATSISNLKPVTEYEIRIKAFDKAADGSRIYARYYGSTRTFKTAVAQVTGLKVTGQTSSTITLTWNAIPGVADYRLSYYDSANKKWQTYTNTSGTTYVVKNRPANTQYSFKVCGIDSQRRCGSDSVQVIGRTNPAAVAGFKLASKGATWLKFSWTAVAGAKYQLYVYNSSSKKWDYVNTFSTNSATVGSRKADTSYTYKVRAIVNANSTTYYGAYSASVNAKTSFTKVTGLAASGSSTNNSIAIKWNKVSGATGYRIYRSTGNSSSYTLLTTVTGTYYKNNNLAAGTVYNYKIMAIKKSGSSTSYGEYSSVLSLATTPKQVTGLKSTGTTGKTVSLSWTAVSGATNYQVYRSTSKNGTYSQVGTATGNTFTDNGLSRKTTYYYKVRAVTTVSGRSFYGSYSSTVSATTTNSFFG